VDWVIVDLKGIHRRLWTGLLWILRAYNGRLWVVLFWILRSYMGGCGLGYFGTG